MSSYDSLLVLRESEDSIADIFEAEFPIVTGRSIKIIGRNLSPDCIASIDDVETGLELTAIHAGDAEEIQSEIVRVSEKIRCQLPATRLAFAVDDIAWSSRLACSRRRRHRSVRLPQGTCRACSC
jgi:hypothetical protein